jgi:hypothetical protein
MLYAGIECGSRYSFLNKLFLHSPYPIIKAPQDVDTFDDIKTKWASIIIKLQQQGIVTKSLPVNWIFLLFAATIDTTIQALKSGDIARNEIKQYAWLSFRNSIRSNEQA